MATITHQQAFYLQGKTLSVRFRVEQLKKLKNCIKQHEQDVMEALATDLGKSAFESYATELGIVYEEISLHIRKAAAWSRPKRVGTPLAAWPAKSYVQAEPLGVCLIIAPWNYPFQLVFAPLIAAISSGNCATLKPSEHSPHVSGVVQTIISETFEPAYVQAVLGDAETSKALLEFPFDLIFFTGSPEIAKHVMGAAAKRLIPVVLELGGKSPCIVDEGANIGLAARRIAWGKTVNSGQTCIAPDYVLVHRKIMQPLTDALIKSIGRFYNGHPLTHTDYPCIINKSHFNRLLGLMRDGEVVFGGEHNKETLKISPTLLYVNNLDSPLMRMEIFGPLLPIIPFETINEAIQFVNQRPKPLALYYFSGSKQGRKLVSRSISAGGITFNDTLMHFTNPSLPFGGVGNSGFGSYHGKAGFLAFSHMKAVMERATWIDIPLRYPPFGKKLSIVRWFMK